MAKKPTYEELAQRIKELEQEKLESNMMKEATIHGEEWPTHKIESKMNPEIHIPEVELGSIVNVEEIQSIMDDLYYLTNMATAILDLKGRVIEATGWQDICTKFHRINPKTALNCTESDLFLAKNLKPGEYVDYKCKNGLWDVVTPLYVGTKHLGNIYTGQFLYNDEQIDEQFFIKQAEVYGFDKDSYIDAFRRIPRYSRETVNHLISFLAKFTTYISSISFVNIQLEKEVRERKRSEEEQEKLQEQLSNAMEMAHLGHWEYDVANDIFTFNDHFYKIFRTTAKQVGGYTMSSAEYARRFVHPDDAPAVGEETRKAIETDDLNFSRQLEHRILYADGTVGHITIRFFIVKDANGRTVKTYGVNQDISERKKAEEERKKLQEQLLQSKKMEAIGSLAGGIAHEFNNILTTIIGNTQLAIGDLPERNPAREFLDEIKSASLRAKGVVRQLLGFARKSVFQLQPVHLSPVIKEAMILVRASTLAAIQIRQNLSCESDTVMVDSSQINLALIKLCTNAKNAMQEEGGVLEVKLENTTLDEKSAAGYEDLGPGNYAKMTVRDTGHGINPKSIDRIFEPYFTTSSLAEATGMGLAVVHGIVKRHNGAIIVQSEPGKGTVFEVLFPLTEKKK
jgi:PAS domain S-box-containing protein